MFLKIYFHLNLSHNTKKHNFHISTPLTGLYHHQVILSLVGHNEHRASRAEPCLHFCMNFTEAETCTAWLIALCLLFRELLVNRELERLDETLSHSAIYEWSEDEKINNKAARWIHNHFWCVFFLPLYSFLLLHISSLRGCFPSPSATSERPSCFVSVQWWLNKIIQYGVILPTNHSRWTDSSVALDY